MLVYTQIDKPRKELKSSLIQPTHFCHTNRCMQLNYFLTQILRLCCNCMKLPYFHCLPNIYNQSKSMFGKLEFINCHFWQLIIVAINTLLNHVTSNRVATGEKMFEPAVTSIFANINLPLFVYFSSSSKCKYFFLWFEINFTIFTSILIEQLLLSKRVLKKFFLMKVFPFCNTRSRLF